MNCESNDNKILIIDDDQEVRSLISDVLADEGYITEQAANEQEAIAKIKKSMPELVFLDLWIGDDEAAGFKIFDKIKSINLGLPIIIISGHGTIDIAVNTIKKGAFDFIEKPFVIDRLLITTQMAFEFRKLRNENIALKNEKLYSEVFSVGKSRFATSIESTIRKIANSNSRVFIDSPVGIGVESIAYKIHRQSQRKDCNFICLSCIDSSEKFENELFGTEKSYGHIERASDGTIFLGEIDKLSKSAQRQLLMLLQNGKYTICNRAVYSDARIICSSTNNSIVNMINADMFSNELFYRLKISEINVPSLKERRDDIIPIVNYYLSRSESLFGLQPKKFSQNAIAILQSYDWPGNILQVKNVVESSLINALDIENDIIDDTFLPTELTVSTTDKMELLNISNIISLPMKEAKERFESDYLRIQVERFSGNISQTANFIGMERSALHRKLKLLNVQCSKKQSGTE